MKKKILILAFIFWGIGCFAGGYLVKANAVEMEVEMETTDLWFNLDKSDIGNQSFCENWEVRAKRQSNNDLLVITICNNYEIEITNTGLIFVGGKLAGQLIKNKKIFSIEWR